MIAKALRMTARVVQIMLADGSQLRYQDVQVEEDTDAKQLVVWRDVDLGDDRVDVQSLARLNLDQISYFVQE